MQQVQYSAQILGNDGNAVKPNEKGVIGLADGELVSVELKNGSDRMVAVEVKFDGDNIGCWGVAPHQKLVIDRGDTTDQRLVFFAKDSKGGIANALNTVDAADLGNVEIAFMPIVERVKEVPPPSLGIFRSSLPPTRGNYRGGESISFGLGAFSNEVMRSAPTPPPANPFGFLEEDPRGGYGAGGIGYDGRKSSQIWDDKIQVKVEPPINWTIVRISLGLNPERVMPPQPQTENTAAIKVGGSTSAPTSPDRPGVPGTGAKSAANFE